MSRITARRPLRHISSAVAVERIDTLAVEEPLEIRLSGRPLAVTMRTPGDDWDLVAGFLATEGVIRSRDDLASMRYCVDEEQHYNVVDAALAPGVPVPESVWSRNFYTTSSCGICGKASIDAVTVAVPPALAEDATRVRSAVLVSMPDTLRSAQTVFERTGGLHAAGLFGVDGDLRCLREDVGRHNAVDKVLGWALREGLGPLSGHVLMVSGRASFELTQKAAVRGVPVLAAVSAPSSLAVDLAETAGVTVVGFLRGQEMNIYTHPGRVLAS